MSHSQPNPNTKHEGCSTGSHHSRFIICTTFYTSHEGSHLGHGTPIVRPRTLMECPNCYQRGIISLLLQLLQPNETSKAAFFGKNNKNPYDRGHITHCGPSTIRHGHVNPGSIIDILIKQLSGRYLTP